VARFQRGDEVWQIVHLDRTIEITDAGKVTVRRFVSAEQARALHDQLVARQLAAGFVAVPDLPPPPPKRRAKVVTTDDPRSPAQERAIEADPDDRDAFAVYGDWLAGQGDARGEWIALAAAAEADRSGRTRASRWFRTHRDYLEGVLETAEVEWRWGFARQITVELANAYLAEILAHPSARFASRLVLVERPRTSPGDERALAGSGDEERPHASPGDERAHAGSEGEDRGGGREEPGDREGDEPAGRGGQAPPSSEQRDDDARRRQNDNDPHSQGEDTGPIPEAPAPPSGSREAALALVAAAAPVTLRDLELSIASTLDTLDALVPLAPRLQRLTVRPQGRRAARLGRGVLELLARTPLPTLERLALGPFVDEVTEDDVARLCALAAPALTHLRLRGPLALLGHAVATSRLAGQLTVLELRGPLSLVEVRALAHHRGRFPRLRELWMGLPAGELPREYLVELAGLATHVLDIAKERAPALRASNYRYGSIRE